MSDNPPRPTDILLSAIWDMTYGPGKINPLNHLSNYISDIKDNIKSLDELNRSMKEIILLIKENNEQLRIANNMLKIIFEKV